MTAVCARVSCFAKIYAGGSHTARQCYKRTVMIQPQLGRLSELLHRRTISLPLLNIGRVNPPVKSIKLPTSRGIREDWWDLGITVLISRHLLAAIRVSALFPRIFPALLIVNHLRRQYPLTDN